MMAVCCVVAGALLAPAPSPSVLESKSFQSSATRVSTPEGEAYDVTGGKITAAGYSRTITSTGLAGEWVQAARKGTKTLLDPLDENFLKQRLFWRIAHTEFSKNRESGYMGQLMMPFLDPEEWSALPTEALLLPLENQGRILEYAFPHLEVKEALIEVLGRPIAPNQSSALADAVKAYKGTGCLLEYMAQAAKDLAEGLPSSSTEARSLQARAAYLDRLSRKVTLRIGSKGSQGELVFQGLDAALTVLEIIDRASLLASTEAEGRRSLEALLASADACRIELPRDLRLGMTSAIAASASNEGIVLDSLASALISLSADAAKEAALKAGATLGKALLSKLSTNLASHASFSGGSAALGVFIGRIAFGTSGLSTNTIRAKRLAKASRLFEELRDQFSLKDADKELSDHTVVGFGLSTGFYARSYAALLESAADLFASGGLLQLIRSKASRETEASYRERAAKALAFERVWMQPEVQAKFKAGIEANEPLDSPKVLAPRYEGTFKGGRLDEWAFVLEITSLKEEKVEARIAWTLTEGGFHPKAHDKEGMVIEEVLFGTFSERKGALLLSGTNLAKASEGLRYYDKYTIQLEGQGESFTGVTEDSKHGGKMVGWAAPEPQKGSGDGLDLTEADLAVLRIKKEIVFQYDQFLAATRPDSGQGLTLGGLFSRLDRGARKQNMAILGDARGDFDLVLVPSDFWKAGAVWHRTWLSAKGIYEFEFEFRVAQGRGLGKGADGFAFVVQSEGERALGKKGGAMGYGGIGGGLALEFDAFVNPECTDPTSDHVSLMQGKDTLSPFHRDNPNSEPVKHPILDGKRRKARITIAPDSVRLYLDESPQPLHVWRVSLASFFPEGKLMVGLTAATGNGSSEVRISRFRGYLLKDLSTNPNPEKRS